MVRTPLLAPLVLLAGLACGRSPEHTCQSEVECAIGWSCIQGMCRLSPPNDAGPVTDGPSEAGGSPETGDDNGTGTCSAPCTYQVCIAGMANCDTTTPDCESRIADAPACFPTYLGTTVVSSGAFWVNAVTIGADDAVYLAGGFMGRADFDPGPGSDERTPVGVPDGFVTKMSPDGSRAWTVTFGATVWLTSLSVSATSLTVAGTYSGTADFDPGPGVAEHTTGAGGFILNLTLDGAFNWVSTLDSDSGCTPHRLAQDANGDFYVAGYFSETCDFDPGPGVKAPPPLATAQPYVMKMDRQGALLWVHFYGGDGCSGALSGVALTRDGNPWVIGQTVGSCYLDGDFARPVPGDGALFAAFDPSGSPRFTSTLGHGTSTVGQAVAAGADGSVYLAGLILEAVDFDPGPGVVMGSPTAAFRPSPRSDISSTGFVLNLTSAGAFRSVYTMGGIEIDGLTTTPDGGVVVMGTPFTVETAAGGLFLTRLHADLTPGSSLYTCGPYCGGIALAKGRSTFLMAGMNGGDTVDVDPGPAVDLLPSGLAPANGVTFLSRYAF